MQVRFLKGLKIFNQISIISSYLDVIMGYLFIAHCTQIMHPRVIATGHFKQEIIVKETNSQNKFQLSQLVT